MTWRWTTGRRAEVRLARAPRWSTMRLSLYFYAPIEQMPRRPIVRIVLDGKERNRFEMLENEVWRFLDIPASELRPGVEPLLAIETSETLTTPERTLGVSLYRADFQPVGAER